MSITGANASTVVLAPATGARILVVDDEENIRFLVRTALELAGFDTASAESGREALERARTYRPDLILLDVMLPDLDGFEVLKALRQAGTSTPVIFLTARDSVDDRVRGLTIGGNDYLAKPFAVAELVARVRLRLVPDGPGQNLRCADLELDPDARRVTRHDGAIQLTPTEYKLLHYLLVNAGRTLSRAQILDHVWAYDFGGDSAILDTYVSYLRRKVDRDHEPKLIHTVRGVGFTLRARP